MNDALMSDTLFGALATVRYVLRVGVVTVVGVLAIVCLLDWLVRTRRVGPFSLLARFTRRSVDPLIAPVERRIVRAGGLPSSAPLWALAGAVIGGILLISAVDFVLGNLASTIALASMGPRGVFVLLVQWTFGVLQVALLVRVVVSWLPVSPYSPWVRWAFTLSEPILAPIRQFIPRVGMFDISPIVAYFVLGLLERAFLSFV